MREPLRVLIEQRDGSARISATESPLRAADEIELLFELDLTGLRLRRDRGLGRNQRFTNGSRGGRGDCLREFGNTNLSRRVGDGALGKLGARSRAERVQMRGVARVSGIPRARGRST